jgi:uncharacterized protein
MVAPAYFAAMTPQRKQNPKTALITGASGGIGLDLARLFAADGTNLVLTARDRGKLHQAAEELTRSNPGVSAHVIAKDLAHPRAPQEIFDELQERSTQIDFLVNNAGYGVYGSFTENNLQDELEMMQLNMVALTHLTKLVLPQMIARGSGRIMNVASTAAFQPGPLMAVYYASKAFVLSFSGAIANELRKTGVTVTCLCPGATETGFAKRAHMEESRLFKMGAMNSAIVARVGYAGMMKGKLLVIPGVRNKLLAQSVRLAPRRLVTAIARSVQERTRS